jgi:hypothetical protein
MRYYKSRIFLFFALVFHVVIAAHSLQFLRHIL